MAQKKLGPNFSSSEDEDEEETSGSETDEVSDTDSDEPQPQQAPKKALTQPPPQSANKPQPPVISSTDTEESGSETESDSDSDSDSPPKTAVVEPKVKSISSEPKRTNVESKLAKTDDSSKSGAISTLPSAKSKRPATATTEGEKDAKKAKQNTANEKPKKGLIGASQSAPDFSSSESEESGSDTESDSDSDSDLQPNKSTVADSNNKHISSKPMEREGGNIESELAKKDRSKTISTQSPAKSKQAAEKEKDVEKAKKKTGKEAPEKSTVKGKDGPKAVLMLSAPNNKRAAANEKEVKKGKNAETEDDTKKQLFQRLWSEDDEVVILQGMIDYKAENDGANPVADMGAFHEFIKKSLHVEVSRSQLGDKVRRLKKKYVNNVGKEKDGKERSFSKSHDQKCYDLSKLIWGSDSHNGETESKKNQSKKVGNLKGTPASLPKSNGVDDNEKPTMEAEDKIDISRFVQYGGKNDYPVLPEEIMKAGMELVDGSTRAELEEKWKELKKQELALYVKRTKLLHEQALIVLEAINSSGN